MLAIIVILATVITAFVLGAAEQRQCDTCTPSINITIADKYICKNSRILYQDKFMVETPEGDCYEVRTLLEPVFDKKLWQSLQLNETYAVEINTNGYIESIITSPCSQKCKCCTGVCP